MKQSEKQGGANLASICSYGDVTDVTRHQPVALFRVLGISYIDILSIKLDVSLRTSKY